MAKKPVAGTPAPAKNSTPVMPPAKPAAPAAAAAPNPAKAPAPASAVASTAVRNSPVPKTNRPATPMATPAAREVTQADIAKRAYEIWASGQGGSETDNWLRAERELRGL
jgi:hypothetical protein